MARQTALLLLLLGLPLVCEGQSLGSVAKKEKERRDKNKEQGVAVREIREDEVRTVEDEPAEEPGAESAADDLEVAPPDAEGIDGNAGAEGSKSSEEEQADRRRQEAEWRARLQDARARVAEARERVKALEELYLAHGEYYVDEQGRTLVDGVDDLQRLNREAKAELEAAEKSLKDLTEEARRAGVPPGWLR